MSVESLNIRGSILQALLYAFYLFSELVFAWFNLCASQYCLTLMQFSYKLMWAKKAPELYT